MRNSFLVNIILLILINLLIKPAYIFAVEIPVQNHVGNGVYGMYFAFLNLAYIFQLLSDLGLQNLTYSELPRDRSKFPQLFSSIVSLRVILTVLFLAALSLAGYFLGYWALDGRLFGIVMLNVLLISTFQYIRANLSGLGLYFQDSLISVVDKLLMLVVMLILIYGTSNFTIYTFVLVQTFSLIAAIGVGMLILQSKIVWIRPTMEAMKSYIRMALPHGILITLMFLYTRVDAIMIERMLSDGLVQAGLYASAYRLYDAVTMISFLFVTLLLPMFSEMDERFEDRSKLYHGGMSMILGMAFSIAIPVILYKDLIMNYLYLETTFSSIQALSILLIAFLWKSSLFITSALLTAHRLFKELTWLFAASVVVNIASNFVVIPTMGIVGASWATLASQVFVALGCLYFVHNKRLVTTDLKAYSKLLLFVGLSIFIGIVCSKVEISASWTSFIILLVGLGLLYLLMNFKLLAQLSREFKRR